ncbi:MAG: hypothetical protein JW748_09905 [Anaerolineales bacterium]|nr:hypothetical protein [Anaerolineales bacterium]
MADHFEVVDTVFGRQEAEIIRSFLRAQDISCEISQEAAGYVIGMTVDGMGAVQILVPSGQREKAMDALQHYRGRQASKALQPKRPKKASRAKK